MKKTLALVLALVMVIGLMAVPVKADFTDSSSIEYTEAVDVLSAAGVINGFENGSFDPDGNLTREQAAKIVAYLLLGEKNADALVATSAPFSDVAADRWSAGYIAYCVNEGIINGRDAKTFDPTGKVTGYEFAKLLLGCLGYSSKIEQYVGASWAINVAKTALDIDLFDGNDGANYNAPMTREEAALYALNTLKATLVDYDSQGTSIDLGNGVVISTGASKAEAVVQGSYDDNMDADDLQFAEKYFEDLVYTAADSDDFARPATSWTYDDEDVGTYSEDADLTYTAAVKGSDIYKALGKPVAAETAYTYYVNGAPVAVTALDDAGLAGVENFKPASDESDKLGKNGVLIEIFERDVTADEADADITEAYDVVIINTYVGEITDWAAADEDDDTEETITIKGFGAGDNFDGDFETTAFTEDDADSDDRTVVLFTYAAGEVQSAVTAESVTGFVSDSSATSFVADGTTYKYSKNSSGTAAYVKDADDTLIYLDTYGYAIYVTDVPDATDEYAYVLDVDSDGMFGGTYYAKLLLPTGETVVAETDVLYDDASAPYDEGHGPALTDTIVSYTVDDDDVYELTLADAAVSDAAIDVNNGKTAIALGADGVEYADSKTIFVVESEDDGDTVYTAYTGIANVPSVSTADGKYAVIADEDRATLADIVFIFGATEDGSSADDLTYLAMESKDDDATTNSNGTYFTVNAVVDGEITTLNLDEDLFTVDTDLVTDGVQPALTGDVDVLLDSYRTNSKGVVYSVTVSGDGVEATGTESEDSGLVGIEDAFLGYDDNTVVFTVDEDGVIAESSIADIDDDDDDTVIYTVDEDDDNLLVSVYITIVD